MFSYSHYLEAQKARARERLIADIDSYINEHPFEAEYSRLRAKLIENDTTLDHIFEKGIIDFLFCAVIARIFVLGTYVVAYLVSPMLLIPLLVFEAIPGPGGLTSVWRAIYFLSSMWLPAVFNSRLVFKEKMLRLILSFVTSWEGGWILSPFVRFCLEEPLLRNVLFWKTKRALNLRR